MRWYVAAVLVLVVALVFDLGLLAYAMYVTLGVLTLSRIVAGHWVQNIEATRECNRLSAEIGDTVAVVVTVHNRGKLPVAWTMLEDILPRSAFVQRPPRLKLTGRRLDVAMLPKDGRKSLYYQLQFLMRGYYQLGPLVIETGDLFGLHRRWRVATEPHFVLVYPRVIPLEGYNVASRRPIGEIKLSHRLYEDPTRIAGVRLYQPGDPLSRVHWQATAHTQMLHSKVYEPSTIAGLSILLDLHRGAYPLRSEPLRSELAITAAASLANAVYHLGQQIGLVTNGRDAADRIRQEGWDGDYRSRAAARQSAAMHAESDRLAPLVVSTRRGADQLRRILETLARVELTDGLTFAQLVLETSSRLPRDATVMAIITDASPETVLALTSLRQRGFAVSAALICFEEADILNHAGRLMNARIDVRTVRNEVELGELCRDQLLAGAR